MGLQRHLRSATTELFKRAYLSAYRVGAMNRVVIRYCCDCRWMLRSAWYAQEILTTFAGELDEVALQPSSGGEFRITCNGEEIWERTRDGGFPDIKNLKQLVRDRIAPNKELGHSDRKPDPMS